MIAFSSSLVRPGFSSTSTPLARKISAAMESMGSEIRTLGISFSLELSCSGEGRCVREYAASAPAFAGAHERGSGGGFGYLIRPVEQGPECGDVLGVHRGPAPDAQARRRVTVTGD